MRAVLQSAFTVTTGLGNLLVVLVEATLNKYLVRVSTCSSHYVIKYSNFTIFPVAIGLFVCWIDVCGHVAFGMDGIKIHIRGLHQERKEIEIHSVHVNHKVLILNLLSQKNIQNISSVCILQFCVLEYLILKIGTESFCIRKMKNFVKSCCRLCNKFL